MKKKRIIILLIIILGIYLFFRNTPFNDISYNLNRFISKVTNTSEYKTIKQDVNKNYSGIGQEKVKNKMKEIDLQGNNATVKDKNMYSILELVLEMYERGYEFLPMDLYKSHASKFLVEEGKIRPPLNSIPGLGTVAAEGIAKAREEGKFMSIDDLKIRSKVGNSVTDLLKKYGCLEGMSQSNQMSLFGWHIGGQVLNVS